jgi:hypothetical protein
MAKTEDIRKTKGTGFPVPSELGTREPLCNGRGKEG